MIYKQELDDIETILQDPSHLTGKLSISTDEKGLFKGFIHMDGKVLFHHSGKTIEETIKYLSFECAKWLGDN